MSGPIVHNQNNVAVTSTPTLIGNMAAGTLILNNDNTKAIYVSPYSNLSVDTGLRIGPLGSITWTQTSPLWAISESGNPVSITVSSAAANPSDPLTVAEALVAQGVPSTLITEVVASNVVLSPGSPLLLSGLSKYSELMFVCQTSPLPTGSAKLSATFFTDGSLASVVGHYDIILGSVPYTLEIAGDGIFDTNIPVVSDVVRLATTYPGGIPFTVYGTNRQGSGPSIYTPLQTPNVRVVALNNITTLDNDFGLMNVTGDAWMVAHMTYPTSTPIPWNIWLQGEIADMSPDLYYAASQVNYARSPNDFVVQAPIIVPAGAYTLHLSFEGSSISAPGVNLYLSISGKS